MVATARLDVAAQAFQALSDPTRLQVIDLLRKGERCVCDLAEVLGAAQSRLSFHLKALKDAGLVSDRREGRWIYYQLEDARIQELSTLLSACCRPSGKWLTGGCC